LPQGYRIVSPPLRRAVEEGVFDEIHYSTPSPESPPLKGGEDIIDFYGLRSWRRFLTKSEIASLAMTTFIAGCRMYITGTIYCHKSKKGDWLFHSQ
jgi:hypothetical protein